MNKAFIACGGTGGHLSPGIALAEALLSRNWECSLLISSKQVDSRLVQKYTSFQYETLHGSPFAIRPIPFFKFVYNIARGTCKCLSLIKRNQPDVVIGFGGFLSMPALLAGLIAGVPTAIHEANQVAGRVTRVVSLFADRIYLPKGVPLRTTHTSRVRYLGMPVRKEIKQWPKSKAKRALDMDPDKKLLVVMGGSQGAESLNNWVKDNLTSFAERDIQVYCLTGSVAAVDTRLTIRSPKGEEVRSAFCRFSDDMAIVLSAADLVISRAGAGSIAEMIRCRAPGILIPYPYSADNHQDGNARNFEMHGCGISFSQDYLSSLIEEVKDIIYNEWLLQRFRANLEAADRGNAQAVLATDLERLAAERSAGPAPAPIKS